MPGAVRAVHTNYHIPISNTAAGMMLKRELRAADLEPGGDPAANAKGAKAAYKTANDFYRNAVRLAPADPVINTAWGELFLEKYDKAAFLGLGTDLEKRRIRIVVYTREGETNGRPAVFAVVIDDENPDQFCLRARLLVTPGAVLPTPADVERIREVGVGSLVAEHGHALVAQAGHELVAGLGDPPAVAVIVVAEDAERAEPAGLQRRDAHVFQ